MKNPLVNLRCATCGSIWSLSKLQARSIQQQERKLRALLQWEPRWLGGHISLMKVLIEKLARSGAAESDMFALDLAVQAIEKLLGNTGSEQVRTSSSLEEVQLAYGKSFFSFFQGRHAEALERFMILLNPMIIARLSRAEHYRVLEYAAGSAMAVGEDLVAEKLLADIPETQCNADVRALQSMFSYRKEADKQRSS